MSTQSPGSVDTGSFPKGWGDKQVCTTQEQQTHIQLQTPSEALEAEEANSWVGGFTSYPGSRSQGRLGL